MHNLITRCHDSTCQERRTCLRYLRRASGAVGVRTLNPWWEAASPCLMHMDEQAYSEWTRSRSGRACDERLSSPPFA